MENSTIQNAVSKGILDSPDFYCNAIVLITRVLAIQWVMLMLIRSVLKPYKVSYDCLSGVGKPRLLKHLWLLHQTGSESLGDAGIC